MFSSFTLSNKKCLRKAVHFKIDENAERCVGFSKQWQQSMEKSTTGNNWPDKGIVSSDWQVCLLWPSAHDIIHDSLTPLLTLPVRNYAVNNKWWVLNMTPSNKKNTKVKTSLDMFGTFTKHTMCCNTKIMCLN